MLHSMPVSYWAVARLQLVSITAELQPAVAFKGKGQQTDEHNVCT